MTDPTLTDETLLRHALARAMPRLSRSERLAELTVGGGFLGAVALLAALTGPDRPDGGLVVLCVALLALAAATRFEIARGWTAPVQVPFVAALFLLPPWVVPLAVAAAFLVAAVPDVLRGRVAPGRLVLCLGNAGFSLGPAALLAAAGSPGPAEAAPALLLGLLATQIGTDFAISSLWHRLATGVSFAAQARESAWVYAVDALLAPVGLLGALVAVSSPGHLLLLAPLLALLAIFGRERRARLEQLLELNGAYRGTAMVLAEVVDVDDAYTGMHTRDVVELSLAVADELGLDGVRRRNIEFGALLHDVGKVAIPDAILNKPGPLDPAEQALMRTHTETGQAMLDRVGGFMRDVGRIVRASHERWDGAGYPDGLAREAIPLEARVIACCDAYDAMTTTRAYRAAMRAEAAVAELVACAGTQFDPQVVAALVRVVGVAPGAGRRVPVRA